MSPTRPDVLWGPVAVDDEGERSASYRTPIGEPQNDVW